MVGKCPHHLGDVRGGTAYDCGPPQISQELPAALDRLNGCDEVVVGSVGGRGGPLREWSPQPSAPAQDPKLPEPRVPLVEMSHLPRAAWW